MFIPYLVSEREAGEWEDCTWASGVTFANGCAGADVHPPTRAEYEALRFVATGVAEGNGDGSNLRELATGLRRRYGLVDVQRGDGWSDLLGAWPVGRYAVLQGDTRELPARLQLAGYRGPHAVAAARDRDGSALVLDPLQVSGAPPMRAYLPELRAFSEGLIGAEWLVGPLTEPAPEPEDEQMRFRVRENVGGRVTVKGTGHSFVLLDGRRIAAPDGQVREAHAIVELMEPLDELAGDRSTFYLVGRCLWPVNEPTNVEAMLLLASAAIPDVVRVELP